MKITDLLTLETIELQASASSKTEILNKAIDLMNKSGVIKDVNVYKEGIFKREQESTTGVGDGVAIPHCKSDTVTKPHLVAMVIPKGVEFNSLDGQKVNLLFMIAAPNTKDNVHLEVLASLSALLMDFDFATKLITAKSKQQFLEIIDKAEANKKQSENKKQEVAKANFTTPTYPRILAATACPTGIAHTYMAQEALEKAAKKRNVTIKVETNGSGGQKNRLTNAEINYAEVIIVAADALIDMDRFNGKLVIQCGTSKAIKDADELIDRAINKKCNVYQSLDSQSSDSKPRQEQKFDDVKQSKFQVFYRHLMSGISHMVPFVVAGGILLAIAYIIDAACGYGQVTDFGNHSTGAQIFHILGADLALGLMMPVIGAFIAYSITGKPGIVSGMVGAFAATKGTFNLMYVILKGITPATESSIELMNKLAANSSGFLGALIAGFAAGYLVLWMRKKWFYKMPRTLEGIRDILIIPLLSTFLIGAFMFLINVPLSYLNIAIGNGLTALNNLNLTLLVGFLVAGLMAIDMGGPINKATHYFVLGILTTELGRIIKDESALLLAKQLTCANLVGIVTPPVGIAIACWLFPRKFSKEDRKPALANVITGCCGITEGAIPYVTKDPIRVVISTVLGAGVGGLISVAWGGVAIAPEGGTISMLIMGAECYKGLLATVIGAFTTGLLLGLIKKDVPVGDAKLGKWKGIPTQPVYNFFAKTGKGIKKVSVKFASSVKHLFTRKKKQEPKETTTKGE